MLEIISNLVYKSDIMREFVKSKKKFREIIVMKRTISRIFLTRIDFTIFYVFELSILQLFKKLQWNTDVELTAGAAVEMPN